MKPMVSICCATYNHEKFIAKTLDSFLSQQGNYDIEILIHDDASTDDTASIIKEYQLRFPDIIKPIFQEENQYQLGVAIDPTFNYPRAQGKYIALCEGDDWWTDLHKLEKQVSIMEKNPEATFLFTNANVETLGKDVPVRDFFPYKETDKKLGLDKARRFNLGEMCKINFAPTASFFFPQKILQSFPDTYHNHYCAHGDLKLRMFATATGYAIYLPDKTCTYRENVPQSAMQIWSLESADRVSERAKTVKDMLKDVDIYSKQKYHKDINEFRDWFAFVMLLNATSVDVLEDSDALRIYKQLPLSKRIRFRLKKFLLSVKSKKKI